MESKNRITAYLTALTALGIVALSPLLPEKKSYSERSPLERIALSNEPNQVLPNTTTNNYQTTPDNNYTASPETPAPHTYTQQAPQSQQSLADLIRGPIPNLEELAQTGILADFQTRITYDAFLRDIKSVIPYAYEMNVETLKKRYLALSREVKNLLDPEIESILSRPITEDDKSSTLGKILGKCSDEQIADYSQRLWGNPDQSAPFSGEQVNHFINYLDLPMFLVNNFSKSNVWQNDLQKILNILSQDTPNHPLLHYDSVNNQYSFNPIAQSLIVQISNAMQAGDEDTANSLDQEYQKLMSSLKGPFLPAPNVVKVIWVVLPEFETSFKS